MAMPMSLSAWGGNASCGHPSLARGTLCRHHLPAPLSTIVLGKCWKPWETKMTNNATDNGTTLTLRDAAKLLAGEGLSAHDAEVLLANAIQHCELHANVKRWATEQWDGQLLPGNINPRETSIERGDLDAWRSGTQAG
jgi:hypothetical protein